MQEAELHDLLQLIWSTISGGVGPLTPMSGPPEEALEFHGIVDINGSWTGTVVLACAEEVGRQVAATMFSMSPSEITDEEIRDAVGEMVNLFAGNVKGCLPGSGKLTIPEVHQGACPVEKHRMVLADVALAFDDHPIRVRLLESASSPTHAE